MIDLKASGYSETERLNILQGGINCYKNLKRKVFKDLRPFYRNNLYNKNERKMSKANKKNTWFKSRKSDSNIKSVIFVDATPDDKLLKMLKETEETYKISNDCRIKFVSRSGTKLVNLLERKNPFETNCNDEECPPCKETDTYNDKLTKCKTDNVTYQRSCKTCELEGKTRVYDGETAIKVNLKK